MANKNITNLVIIGSGALAAESYGYISDINQRSENKIKVLGFIDDMGPDNFQINKNKYQFNEGYLGTTQDFSFPLKNKYLIAFSDIQMRAKHSHYLQLRGVEFINLIHPTANISTSAQIGFGNIFGAHVIVGPNVKLGNHNVLTAYSFISHDCIVGSQNFFSTAGLAGHVLVGSRNFFGIRSTAIPSVVIGDDNVMQAGMLVDKNVSNSETVFYKFKERIFLKP